MVYYPIDIEKSVRKECRRRRYSEKTVKTYLYWINGFLQWSGKGIDKISKKDVRVFLEYLDGKNKAGNTLNTAHMAIRFLFVDVLEKRMWIDIKYSKIPSKLPRVLSKEEVRKLLGNIENWKHRLMIELMYSAGLRVSEVVNLRVGDLVLGEGYGFVRNGKGRKDRIFVLAKIVREKIGNLIEIEKLAVGDNLFVSGRGGKYSIRSLQVIVRKAGKKAKLGNVYCHLLRHSYATHLIENGYNVSDVQAMLGHKSPETSMVYVHSASKKIVGVRSPLDSL